jgi:hypothetical protein
MLPTSSLPRSPMGLACGKPKETKNIVRPHSPCRVDHVRERLFEVAGGVEFSSMRLRSRTHNFRVFFRANREGRCRRCK